MRVSISVLVLLAAQLPAQYLAGVVEPVGSVWPGQPVQLTVSATTACPGVRLAANVVSSVHQGAPAGPVVGTVPMSALPPIDLQPFDTASWWASPWSYGSVPGAYYLRVDWSVPSTGETGTEWYPVWVGPTLNLWVPGGQAATNTELPIGETTAFWFSGPGCSGFPYFSAVSSSTNVGLPVPGAGHMVLDMGTPLWDMSWPNPHPALFEYFQGQMSTFGTGMCMITLPNLPQLVGMPVVLQVAAAPPNGGGIVLTNPLAMVVSF